MIFFNKIKYLSLILLVGFIVRLIFTFFIAGLYFNRADIYTDADTGAWALSFQNLIESGSYSVNLQHEYGYFGRMPGYSFFLGIFWLIIGNWESVYPVVALVQMILDVFAIWLVYKMVMNVFNFKTPALISSALYAFYPFIIVWNPVCYSESLSVFLMIASLYFLTQKTNNSIFISGILLGIGILFRPQLLFLIPLFSIVCVFYCKKIISKFLILFILAITITYGLWPVRNYLLHNKIILTQDLRGLSNWNTDVISFMQYTYSVKAEWEPQFTSIIKNTQTQWPQAAYISRNDSLLLEYAVYLSKHCGSGFSHWRGYWKDPVNVHESCNRTITDIYSFLRNNQIRKNPYNFWVAVPLSNLSKALFKNSLTNNSGMARKAASMLFYFRTLLILLGLAGIFLLLKRRNIWGWVFLLFFLFVYISLCFGTGPQMRNIEMRYFLHVDILLLIPAGYLISLLFKKQKAV
jgi:hypothetical protein